MLFSRDEVARHISDNFEPAWEMVRPVPLVRIDFGGGRVVNRTLRGNIASYVCAADGQVLDILPGAYEPTGYVRALGELRRLAGSLPAADIADRQTRLRDYHQAQAAQLRGRSAVAVAQAAPGNGPRLDRGKAVVERPLLGLLGGPGARPPRGSALANWQRLAEDTLINESQRRLQIHQRLAGAGNVRPEQIKHWLYREVLHADLDDPYLGLGDIVQGDDIFVD